MYSLLNTTSHLHTIKIYENSLLENKYHYNYIPTELLFPQSLNDHYCYHHYYYHYHYNYCYHY